FFFSHYCESLGSMFNYCISGISNNFIPRIYRVHEISLLFISRSGNFVYKSRNVMYKSRNVVPCGLYVG
ncbi:hypothetical protein L9F63_010733, partial [Diploptera punctata]